jgi:hypothetical protein
MAEQAEAFREAIGYFTFRVLVLINWNFCDFLQSPLWGATKA